MKRLSEDSNNNSIKKFKDRRQPQELGIIESICLKNFMCHEHLKFDFDPHINFIIGQNGSGKSAILTGIILALGGKSSSTGRYNNIRGFIKTGKQKAFISVVLKNGGPFAYKPEMYGDKIVIEREISVDGVSSYKLKSEAGRIISNQKEELNNILNAMDIQIENPVVVLTQETSRNFLMSKHGKEEKLYEFFYKGTGLQSLEDKYQSSSNLKDEALSDLQLKKEALPGMEKELRRWKAIIDSDSKVDDLRKEKAWAIVQEMEKIVEEHESAVRRKRKELNTSKAEVERCKTSYEEITSKLEQFQKDKMECDKKMASLRTALGELKEKKEELACEVRKYQCAVDQHKALEKKLVDDITALESSITENHRRNQTNFDEKKRECDEKIQKLEAQIQESDVKKENLQKRNDLLQRESIEAQHIIDSINAELSNFKYKKDSLLNSIDQMRKGIKDRQVLFGRYTEQVLNEIRRRNHEFRQTPIGPIGLYVEVKDPKWNNAVETCLKRNILNSFCCDNAKDSTVLSQILKQYYPHNMPSIIVSKYLQNVHDVSNNKTKTQSNFPTVFDMLKVKNSVVTNCLIDQLSIENVILIEDIATAQSVMLDNPPSNCYSAFLLNCDEILLNPYRHYSAARKITNSVLQSVNMSHIKSLELDLQSIEKEIQHRNRQLSEYRSRSQTYPQEMKRNDNEIVKLSGLKSRNTSLINDLNLQKEEPKDISGMQDDLIALKAELAEKRKQLEDSETYLSQYRKDYNEISKKFSQEKDLLTTEKSNFDDLGQKINSYGKKKEIIATHKKQFETSCKEAEAELALLQAELNDSIEKTQMAIDSANNQCERIKTNRSSSELEVQICETMKVIEQESNCKRKDLIEKYKEKVLKKKRTEADLQKIKNTADMLDRMLKRREKKLKEFIKHTQHCLDLCFSVVLKSNHFAGHLDFSKPGCLRLEATPRQQNPEVGGKKHCSSLSGGERSFVTIAFLLALWDRIRMPFRILDEYDVFMDSNNRNLSVNLLIKRADFMKNVQFIFLSPLDLPEMLRTDNIKVHKMPAPKRTGLTFTDE